MIMEWNTDMAITALTYRASYDHIRKSFEKVGSLTYMAKKEL